MPQMSVPERASLWGIRKERKRKKGWTDYIGDPSEAIGTSLEPHTPGPPPSPRTPPPPPPMVVPLGMFDVPPPIPPLPKRPGNPSSSSSSPSSSALSLPAEADLNSSASSSLQIDTSSFPTEVSDTDTLSPLEPDDSEAKDDALDQDLLDQIEIEVQPDSPTHVSRPLDGDMEIDWESLINDRLARGKTNPILPGSSRPSQSSLPTIPAEFIDTPAKKVERKKKDLSGFDMMAYLRAGPPVPHMPSWAEEHRKFLLDRQMRQKFEPPFRLFCVREDQGSQRQPWPMPWEDSDRDPSDSEQEELARQERKAARQAKRRAKRRAIKKEERRRQREELLKQAKKLAQQEVDEARAAREDAESRDSDDEDERKSFGKLLSVESDSNDDQDEDEVSEDSLGTEAETTPSEDDDSFTDMAKQLSHNTPWMKKRLSEVLPKDDNDEEPQSELEKRLVKGDKFRMYDGPESDDIKIFVDIKNRCLRFEGSVDDGVSLTTASFQLKRGICDLDENNQLQPTTVFPEPGMDSKVCMTLATGRANEKGVLQATNVEQIDAWVDGVYALRERFLDDALRIAMRQVTDSEEEEDEASSGDEMEVSFEHPSSSPKITPKKKPKALLRDVNSSESEDEEDPTEERIENVIKSTHAIPLEWTVVNNNTSTIADISPVAKKLLQEEVGSSDEGDDDIPEAVIHLPTSTKPKRSRRSRVSVVSPVASTPAANFSAVPIQSTETVVPEPVILHQDLGEKDSSHPADDMLSKSDTSQVPMDDLEAKPLGNNIKIVEEKEEPVPRVNSRAGRTRRAAVAVKPSVPIPRHIPEDEETDSAEAKAETPVRSALVTTENKSDRIESEAEKQMRELETVIGLESVDPVSRGESEAERQTRELEATTGFEDTTVRSVPELENRTNAEHNQENSIHNSDLTVRKQDEDTLTHAERQMKTLEADFGFEPTTELKQKTQLVAKEPEVSVQGEAPTEAKTNASTKSESKLELELDVQQRFDHSKDSIATQQVTEAERQMKALEADFGFESTSAEMKQITTGETHSATASEILAEKAKTSRASLPPARVSETESEAESEAEPSDPMPTEPSHDMNRMTDAEKQMKDLEADFGFDATSSELKQVNVLVPPAPEVSTVSEAPILNSETKYKPKISFQSTESVYDVEGSTEHKIERHFIETPTAVLQADPTFAEELPNALQDEAISSAPVSNSNSEAISESSSEVPRNDLVSVPKRSDIVSSNVLPKQNTGATVNQILETESLADLRLSSEYRTSIESGDVDGTARLIAESSNSKNLSSRAGRTRRSAVAVKPNVRIVRHSSEDESTNLDEIQASANIEKHEIEEDEASKQMLELETLIGSPGKPLTRSLEEAVRTNVRSETENQSQEMEKVPKTAQIIPTRVESEAEKKMQEFEATIGCGVAPSTTTEEVTVNSEQSSVKGSNEDIVTKASHDSPQLSTTEILIENEMEKQLQGVTAPISTNSFSEVLPRNNFEEKYAFTEEAITKPSEAVIGALETPSIAERHSLAVESLPLQSYNFFEVAPVLPNTNTSVPVEQYSMFWSDTVAQLEQSQPSESEPVLAVAVDIAPSPPLSSTAVPLDIRGVPIGEESDGKVLTRKEGLTEPLLLEDPAHAPKRKSKSICGDCVLL